MSSSFEHNGGNSPSPPDASNLDTTLLESLFYNEMMMLEDSSELLSSVTAVATGETAHNTSGTENSSELIPPEEHSEPEGMGSPTPTTTTHSGAEHQPSEDPLTYAEQSLLRDFGVTGSPIPHISDDTTDRKSDYPYPQQSQPQHHPQESWNGQQQSHQYQHQNQDPNRYPPHQPHYQGDQDQQHYHSSHPPSHYQQQYQQTTIQTYIQPRPPQHNVSKGIKHSVVPKQPPATQKNHPLQEPSAGSPPPLIPNAIAHHPPQPQHHHSHTQQQQQHLPQYNPHPHQPVPAHPHHPQQPQQQPHHPPTYHQPYPHHHQGAPTPSLVPVPAPTPGHHHQSAFHSPPPYANAPGAPPHIVVPVAVSHHHAPRPQHPHHHPHAHAPPPLVAHHQPHPAYSHATQPPPQPPPKEQLVSQFATLANRLGINLPPNLLASLTKSAGMVSGGIAPSSGVGSTGEQSSDSNGLQDNKSRSASGMEQTKSAEQGTTTSNTAARRGSMTGEKSPLDNDTLSPPQQPSSGTVSLYLPAAAPMTEALRKTAEEAIATVTRKRSHEDAETSGDLARPPSAGSGGNGSDTNSKTSYAKRRKKPRLSDCENRLAQLRAENEKLKRHLDNVTNQTEKFNQDRIKAEQTMKQMLESDNVPDEELNRVIQEYSEAYSDYGKRRHEELSFHLDQLEKLANPTNFTKMGLWTIAKANDSKDLSKQNPLIGILSKELNISPQQTRKILDQRQKIRDLCNNLNASLLLLQKLKDLCEQKNKTFNDRMTKTREILTPKQVVKLIMWIKDYSDVLGNICPGWTSEQVVKRSKTPISSSEKPAATSKVEDPKPTDTKSEPTL